ncbi:hypothetical protein PPERSA_10138 [Pseudocohnilembus persalinus]|uniref:Uncharacterized protein n=1 Tax=Pseudocohnilembus persalinus TaxID=266149 RepID=A0A0V0R021_PSEPJ|nr:hypothetical protein PPERSA_10138 [Pseudocohnilembus persalinus]|eukprot:KRX07854.1 hypothetical protein PPERSA_10138 [Pseudocohnilembus persalinus]
MGQTIQKDLGLLRDNQQREKYEKLKQFLNYDINQQETQQDSYELSQYIDDSQDIIQYQENEKQHQFQRDPLLHQSSSNQNGFNDFKKIQINQQNQSNQNEENSQNLQQNFDQKINLNLKHDQCSNLQEYQSDQSQITINQQGQFQNQIQHKTSTQQDFQFENNNINNKIQNLECSGSDSEDYNELYYKKQQNKNGQISVKNNLLQQMQQDKNNNSFNQSININDQNLEDELKNQQFQQSYNGQNKSSDSDNENNDSIQFNKQKTQNNLEFQIYQQNEKEQKLKSPKQFKNQHFQNQSMQSSESDDSDDYGEMLGDESHLENSNIQNNQLKLNNKIDQSYNEQNLNYNINNSDKENFNKNINEQERNSGDNDKQQKIPNLKIQIDYNSQEQIQNSQSELSQIDLNNNEFSNYDSKNYIRQNNISESNNYQNDSGQTIMRSKKNTNVKSKNKYENQNFKIVRRSNSQQDWKPITDNISDYQNTQMSKKLENQFNNPYKSSNINGILQSNSNFKSQKYSHIFNDTEEIDSESDYQ